MFAPDPCNKDGLLTSLVFLIRVADNLPRMSALQTAPNGIVLLNLISPGRRGALRQTFTFPRISYIAIEPFENPAFAELFRLSAGSYIGRLKCGRAMGQMSVEHLK